MRRHRHRDHKRTLIIVGVVAGITWLAAVLMRYRTKKVLWTTAVCIAAVLLVLFLLLALSGCTWNRDNLEKVVSKQDERSRELVQSADIANKIGAIRLNRADAVLETLDESLASSNALRSVRLAGRAYDLSGNMITREQAIVGLPAIDQTRLINDLLSENEELQTLALELDSKRQDQESTMTTERRVYERQLLEMGKKYEAEQNANVVKKTWRWLRATFGIGGLIALLFFFPFLIPIFGRIFGWIVSKIPILAGAVGVVSTKAFDAVVKGVEGARAEKAGVKKAPSTSLDTHLRAEMDFDHKALVRQRKASLNIATAPKPA